MELSIHAMSLRSTMIMKRRRVPVIAWSRIRGFWCLVTFLVAATTTIRRASAFFVGHNNQYHQSNIARIRTSPCSITRRWGAPDDVDEDWSKEDDDVLSSKGGPEEEENDDDDSMAEWKHQLDQQQKQIDQLVQLLQSQQSAPPPGATISTTPHDASSSVSASPSNAAMDYHKEHHANNVPSSVSATTIASSSTAESTAPPTVVVQQQPPPTIYLAPLKVMLFVDGTWLYYTLYERQGTQDMMSARYGANWKRRYTFHWEALPNVLAAHLSKQASSSQQLPSQQPLQVVRTTVFTSYKADTSKSSFRYRMFQDMKAANYDVYMMETVGRGEKCVDIQLAVEMLHYATVPHAYDIGLLLTGDKDFMPAMQRTRQKARQVGLVSGRGSCNRALYETPGCKDFDVLWLEDVLDQFVVPISGSSTQSQGSWSANFFLRIIADFVAYRPMPGKSVSSRDLGRFLKFWVIPPASSVLGELKLSLGGIFPFLRTNTDLFAIDYEVQKRKIDKKDNSFGIVFINDQAYDEIQQRLEKVTWSESEAAFFSKYTVDVLQKHPHLAYSHTYLVHDLEKPSYLDRNNLVTRGREVQSQVLTPTASKTTTTDYGQMTVKDLKEICREKGLPVSGRKAELIERIEESQPEVEAQEQPEGHRQSDDARLQYLCDLVEEYLKASGGKAFSRDIGRYLAANRPHETRITSPTGTEKLSRFTALSEVKQYYGGLQAFIKGQPEKFWIDWSNLGFGEFDFEIHLKSLQ